VADGIGVVVRTLNEGAWIEQCIDVLRAQNGGFALDIVVVDSGSTDATVELARAKGVRIVEIAPADFDYSKALNLGIGSTSGELVVSLSAHAIPADDDWLVQMGEPFADPRVAGVASRQVPWPDAPWQEVRRLAETFGDERVVYGEGDAETLVFSNAASMFRRTVWEAEPFTLPSVEDLDWARRAVRAGHAIVYQPTAVVRHSHRESPRAQALRLVDINRVTGGPGRTWRRTLREGAGLLVRDGRTILGLEEPRRRKLAHLWDLLQVVVLYVAGFSRGGTLAERRRAAG